MRPLFLGLALALTGHATAQQVLHFTKTSGFDHQTREVSLAMFQAIAAEMGVAVTDDTDGTTFSDPTLLAAFSAVIFSNTSGSDLLDATQRTHFEAWVNAGGHVMGIHAASDTYRHSTANGDDTGDWDFYAELIGASVQSGPHHVEGTPPYELSHIGTHASTAQLPAPWLKHEEYYYWEHGYFGPDNTVVLEVEETVGPNGQVNSYDAPRPMSWYRELPTGSRVFYTALGHAQSNYTDDMLFRQHVQDALTWLLGAGVGIHAPEPQASFQVYPNPATEVLTVVTGTAHLGAELQLIDVLGRPLMRMHIRSARTPMPVHHLPDGGYMLKMGRTTQRIAIQR